MKYFEKEKKKKPLNFSSKVKHPIAGSSCQYVIYSSQANSCVVIHKHD